MGQKIYAIPGFGVDDKIFSNLQIPNASFHFINWLDPEPKESLVQYAKRMAAGIDSDDPIIIGISFGGMIALEIAKLRNVKQIILISSIKTRAEMPLHMRFAGLMHLNKLFPVKNIQQSEKIYAIANRRLGAITEEEKSFANVYRRTAKLDYINWSFDKILNWSNKEFPVGTIHVHGNKDQIFPIKTIKPTHVIEGGTHMMVWNRAAEVSKIITETLSNLQ